MAVHENSLSNLEKGSVSRFKDARRVTLTLKPETVELLKRTGNMSASVDKLVAYVKAKGLVGDALL